METKSEPRTRLDRSTVLMQAFEIADSEGLEALTIRRLAKELGVTPMALYWHFADKQALLDALADQLWADARAGIGTADDGDNWAEIRRILDALIASFRQHPQLAPLAPLRAIGCEAGLAITERTLALLDGLGFSPARAADLARFALCAAIMLVGVQPGAGGIDDADREDQMRRKRADFAALPPQRYPYLASAIGYLTDCDIPDGYFGGGLDLIIGGMKAQTGVPSPT